MFHQPLSAQAYQQWEIVNQMLSDLELTGAKDEWKHMKQTVKYLAFQVYK